MLIIADEKKVFVLRHVQGLSVTCLTIIGVHICWMTRPSDDGTVASSVSHNGQVLGRITSSR